MGLFSFDNQYRFFDVTPVDNLFIQEYLPSAKGDYVKVYLYGLMHTYHRNKELTLAIFAREVNLSETEVENAFRYWERRGLVQQTAENPKSYRYLSAKQMLIAGKTVVDETYEDFCIALNDLFGAQRKLHGGETSMAFEWVEELRLPQDVVLRLIAFLIETRGKNFTFKSANKVAVALAEEKIQTVDDAMAYLAHEKAVYEGVKKVLRRMGKRRLPSEDEIELYAKWIKEYSFSEEQILQACRETVKGDPNMAYLDAVLRGMKSRNGDTSQSNREKLKELCSRLGIRQTVSQSTLLLYEQMTLIASHEIILLAADECARTGGKLDDVMNLISSWQNKHLDTAQKVRDYIAAFNAQNAFLQDLYTLWGKKNRPTASDRQALLRWQNSYGFSREAICVVAPYAEHTERPVAYMESILKSLNEKGVKTPEAISKEMAAYRQQNKQTEKAKGKSVSHQHYEQREYHEDDLSELKAKLSKEEKK